VLSGGLADQIGRANPVAGRRVHLQPGAAPQKQSCIFPESGEVSAKRMLALSLGKKVPQSPALRDPAFHSFESGKTSPEIEHTMMLQPTSH
jgi:hypothetical protein